MRFITTFLFVIEASSFQRNTVVGFPQTQSPSITVHETREAIVINVLPFTSLHCWFKDLNINGDCLKEWHNV